MAPAPSSTTLSLYNSALQLRIAATVAHSGRIRPLKGPLKRPQKIGFATAHPYRYLQKYLSHFVKKLKKTSKIRNVSRTIRNFPKTVKCSGKHPNVSECVRTGPNGAEQIRTCPKSSKNSRKHEKNRKNLGKKIGHEISIGTCRYTMQPGPRPGPE